MAALLAAVALTTTHKYMTAVCTHVNACHHHCNYRAWPHYSDSNTHANGSNVHMLMVFDACRHHCNHRALPHYSDSDAEEQHHQQQQQQKQASTAKRPSQPHAHSRGRVSVDDEDEENEGSEEGDARAAGGPAMKKVSFSRLVEL